MVYDVYGRTEPSNIYIARPGKNILGVLTGIDRDSCSLTVDFVNADNLTFNVYKYHDEELTAYYDYVDILMEIFVDGYGWFFIDESPEVHNDGIDEYKSVTAKSYEYTLHQYDLVTFDVNTASETSREMLATDNVYTYSTTKEVWYNLFRDRVLFYRDSSEHKAILEEMHQLTTFAELQELFATYPHVLYSDWRFEIDIGSELRAAFVTMKNNATTSGEIALWNDWISAYDSMIASQGSQITSDAIKTLILSYPDLAKYVLLKIDKKKYLPDEDGKYVETNIEYTPYQLMELECQRIQDLSLMDLVISDVPGWSIGTIDNSLYEEHADSNGVPILLKDEVGTFEIDSQDVYSFLVTELAGYFECIFQFDTYNNVINAYRIETPGEDTEIFISFRNVQNNVDITPAQELFTQFTVENTELMTITEVNFGQREIEDLSYFLNTKYLPQSLIDKYKRWREYRESRREDYIELSRQYNKQVEVKNELMNRVPSDMLNTSQLSNYTSQDQLEQVIDNYYAMMIGMLNNFIYVSTKDTHPPNARETYDTYEEYLEAMDDYIDELEALVDVGMPTGGTTFEDSLYYKDYYLMKNFTVPNLIITYNNLSLPSYEDKEDYYDSFEFDFQTYGWMYGVDELTNYRDSHKDKMEVFSEYATAWNDIPDTPAGRAFKAKYNQDDYTSKHNIYVKYYNGYVSASSALATRKAEYDQAVEDLKDIGDARLALADALKMENYSEEFVDVVFYELPEGWFYDEEEDYLVLESDSNFFTADEIEQITRFYRHTDYVNDNINYLEYVDTVDTEVDKQLELYNEAIEELYAESHPQYAYTTTVDNLLANNEYADFHPDFKVGNFIMLGLDDETQVKLRMISIAFNPMTLDENLEITFSNTINYRSRRNDFTSLIDSAITSAKNSITARYNRSADSDNTIQVTYDLIQKILQSSPFKNASQNIQASSVSASTGAFNTLTAGFIKTDELAAKVADIEELHADSAFVNYLNSTLVVASEIKVDDLKAKLAQVDTLTAGSAFVNYLTSLSSTTAAATITDAYIYNAVAGKITVGDLAAGDIVLSNQMRILSETGGTDGMIMSGSQLQFLDDNGNPSISIGYNRTGESGVSGQSGVYGTPSIVIKDANGAVMLNSGGLSQGDIGIASMIQTSSLSKTQLNFPIVEANAQGGVDITQIYDGQGNLWGLEYNTFKNNTESAINDIESQRMYRVVVESDNGIVFKNGVVNCTLSCHVYSWDEDITDDLSASNFIWTRQSDDSAADATWNSQHSTGSKTLTLTSSDVSGRAVFSCNVTLPSGESGTS